MAPIDEKTRLMLEEQSRRIEETSNVGERLLAEGKSIVYWQPGLEKNQLIHEFPDGRKLLIRMENGRRVSEEPYNG